MIVVGPKRVIRDTWPKEIEIFPNIQIDGDCFLYTYQELVRDVDEIIEMIERLPEFRWTLVIDEIHLVKNPKTLRSKAITKLRKKCHFVWGMTGTPCDTRPMDLFGISEVIGSPISPSKNAFTKEYCESKEIPIYSGYSRYPKYYMHVPTAFTKEGYEKLKDWFDLNLIRRPPDESLIPTPIYAPPYMVDMTKSQSNNYDEVLKGKFHHREGGVETHNSMLVELIRLRQVTSGVSEKDGGAKTLALFEDILPQLADRKVIVYSPFVDTLKFLHSKCPYKSMILVGGTSDREAEHNLKTFREDGSCQVLFISDCAATGLNLQVASALLIYDRPDGYSKLLQLTGRVVRRGQKHHAFIQEIRCKNTVEDWLTNLIDRKEEMMSCINALGEGDIEQLRSRLRGKSDGNRSKKNRSK